MILLYGDLAQSEFVRQSLAYSEHLASNNGTVKCLAIKKADHFTVLDLFVDEERDFVKEIVRFGQEIPVARIQIANHASLISTSGLDYVNSSASAPLNP